MSENEKDAPIPADTDTSLPRESWEKKLMEHENTALFSSSQAQTTETETDSTNKTKNSSGKAKLSSGRGLWALLLLLTFTVSACCGLYLTIKPVSSCEKEVPSAQETADDEPASAKIADALKKSKLPKTGIAWIKVRGVIAQDNSSGPFSRPTGAGAIAKKIRDAADDKNVKAIVLDINSPGGTVASVQNIYGELLKAKENGKQIVALFRDVAASGGFYIAMAADKIVAEPGTITGSVGVIMQTSNVEGLFDKIGVKVMPITSGKYKDMGSAYRPMTDAEKAILQDMVNDTYTQFFAAVKAGRPNVTPENLTEYTDGRVFTGQRAFNLGFIDKLGGEEEARLLAGELAGIKDPKIINQRPSDGLRELIFSFGSSMENQSLTKQLQSLATPSVSYLWVN